MRPCLLKMKAFGSYAEETSIDFDEIGKTLYLITGDTGTGKTTIFDAIVFALYGKASGQRREACMMHSDYVGYDTPTVVSLEFEHNGKRNRVERRITYSKSRKTGEYNPDGKIDAEYWEADKAVIKGSSAVTSRIEEQLGLSVDQFRKIVMLAQGDFRRFLDSKDDERAEILKKLFDFSNYTKFQNWIVDIAEKLGSSRKEHIEKVNILMGAFLMPEDLSDEEKMLYDAAHPMLMSNLENLIKTETFQLKDSESKKQAAYDIENSLKTKLELCLERNKKLDRLFEISQKNNALKQKEPYYDALNIKVKRTERAVRNVFPVERELISCKNTLEDTTKNISLLENQKENLQISLSDVQKQSEAAHTHDAEIENLLIQTKKIEDSLPLYNDIEEITKTVSAYKLTLSTLNKQILEKEAQKSNTEKKLQSIDDELDKLKNAETDHLNAENSMHEAENRLADFKKLVNDIECVNEAEKQLLILENALSDKTIKVLALKEKYDNCYNLFILNQAGQLAEKLKDDIRNDGKAACPVCGSLFTAVPDNGFAEITSDSCTEADVTNAKKAFEYANNERQALVTKRTVKCNGIKTQKEILLTQACELLNAELVWNNLIDEDYLVDIIKKFKNRFDDAVNDHKKKAADIHRKKELSDERSECNILLEKYHKTAETNRFKFNELQADLAKDSALLTEKKKNLNFESKLQAQAEIAKLKKRSLALDQNVKQADETVKIAKSKLDNIEGRLRSSQEKLPYITNMYEASQEKLANAITEYGFTDYEDYRSSIPEMAAAQNVNINLAEQWINDQNAQIAKYDQMRHDNELEINNLSSETNGWVIVDIDDMKLELNKAKETRKATENEYNKKYSVCEHHKKTYTDIKHIKQGLSQTDNVYKRLLGLSKIANGYNTDGGKYSFERFAMGEAFKEILDAANVRLLIMSTGRYELIHQITGKTKASQAGLGIEVLDNTTGKQREANSISGGESFQVSMSLALGLSDVVQRHARGRAIESMFIDEGFGTLSDLALDQAIKALEQLAGTEKQIGIISHVASLKESIGPKIIVKSDKKRGSFIRVE